MQRIGGGGGGGGGGESLACFLLLWEEGGVLFSINTLSDVSLSHQFEWV